MNVISSEEDFLRIDTCVDAAIEREVLLPERVFCRTLKHFLFITFDELFMPYFFNYLKRFVIEAGGDNFWLTALDPDPNLYFCANFNFLGTFNFSCSDPEHEYISAMNDYPSDSLADALSHNANILVLSSMAKEWAIYGSRDADIAICAFSNMELMETFRKIYGSDLLGGLKSAAQYAYGRSADVGLAERFCSNYSCSSTP